MKAILALATVFVLLGCVQSAQSQFALRSDKENITVNAGETALFTISFTIENKFDASIFLTYTSNPLQIQNGGATLSADIVNAPYQNVTLTVTTAANFTKGGIYEFRITGRNGALTSSVLCRVNVVSTPRSNWHFMPYTSKGAPWFVQQDAEGFYWHNYNGIQREKHDTPLEQWGNATANLYGNSSTKLVVDTKNNKKWITLGGFNLSRYTLDGRNETIYTPTISPLPNHIIYSMTLDDHDGSLWVGTGAGLARITGTEWTVFTTTNTNAVLDREPITCMAISGSTVWMGTIRGLVKFDGNEWTRYSPQNSALPAPFIRNIAVEANGNVWMGVSNEINLDSIDSESMVGLVKFDGTNWTLYNSENIPLLKENRVNSIAIDSKGNKWIATASHLLFDHTSGAGILKFDNTTWTAYTKANTPLPDNRINWVGVDNNDNIWFHQLIQDHSKSFWGVFNENGLPPNLTPPTSVEEQPETTDGIALYPNPTNTTFTISGADNILSVKLMNSLGMEISRKSSVVSGKVEMAVEDLASDVYFVQLRTPTGMITKSIVVSR